MDCQWNENCFAAKHIGVFNTKWANLDAIHTFSLQFLLFVGMISTGYGDVECIAIMII